jgi:predicted  nucleic acid-binding Zn-ribbon protein
MTTPDAPREITVEDLDYLDKMAERYGKQPSDGWVIGYDEWVMVSAAARRALSQAGGEMPKHCPDCGRMLVPFQIRSEGDLPGLPLHAGEALFVFPASQSPSPSVSVERERETQRLDICASCGQPFRSCKCFNAPDTPQSVPTCTCSKHPLWDGYDGDCPIHGWFEPVAPDTPQSVPADKPCTCHPDDNPPDPCAKQYAYSECVKATPDAPLSQGRYAKSVTAGQAKMSEQIEALIAERDAYRNSVAPIQNRLEALEAERDKLGTDIALHESLAHGYTDQIATLEVLAQSRLTDLEAFKAYADRLEAERDRLTIEKGEFVKELRGLMDDNDALRKRHSILAENHASLRAERDRLRYDNDLMAAHYKEWTAERGKLMAENGELALTIGADNLRLVERVSVLEEALKIIAGRFYPTVERDIARAALRTSEDAK